MASRLTLLTILLLAGCSVDSQMLSPPPLAPVAVENPRVRLPSEVPDDVRVAVHRVCRGSRGGVLLVEVDNIGERPVQFSPQRIDVLLSSGYRRRFISATEFKHLGDEFGVASYGIVESDPVAHCQFADESTTYLLQPGESKEIPFPFGARSEETHIVLDFEPALQRAKHVHPPGKLRIAVELPPVAPPRQSFWPEWVHVGFAFTNAG